MCSDHLDDGTVRKIWVLILGMMGLSSTDTRDDGTDGTVK